MRLDQPPGTVAILASEAGRYTSFWVSMISTGFSLPAGTAIKAVLGSDISESRNQVCAEFEGEWVWFIDDDHTFAPDIVMQLLARDVDIVTPICLRRNSPFYAVPAVDDNFLDLTRYQPDELVEVQHAGSSGMLIRRKVIEALDSPWFELGHREGDGNRISEDVNFCRRAQEAGFKVHVDMGARLAHLTTVALWPAYSTDEERWLTGLTVADGAELYMDPASMPELRVSEVTGPEAVPVPEIEVAPK